jgi:hypothetical protein
VKEKIYQDDWMSLSIASNSIEEFFETLQLPKCIEWEEL